MVVVCWVWLCGDCVVVVIWGVLVCCVWLYHSCGYAVVVVVWWVCSDCDCVSGCMFC